MAGAISGRLHRLFERAKWPVAVLVAAVLLAVIAVAVRGDASRQASAVFTPTDTPVGMPKPDGAGPISGLVDLDIGPGLYKCIAYTDQDSVNTTQVKSAVQCYVYFDSALAGSEPPCSAQHSMAGGPTPAVPGEGNCAGHLGPPPYTPRAPAKAGGTYSTADGGTVSVIGCFEDLGGTLGPNVIAKLSYAGADAFHAAADDTVLVTSVDLWLGSTNAECTAAETTGSVPAGTPQTLATTMTKRASARDFDSDGCTDVDELLQNKPGLAAGKCGDDPWNPHDLGPSSTDVSGVYDILGRVVRNDTVAGAGYNAFAAGHYYLCKADVQQVSKALTARILCYVDSPSLMVNPPFDGKAENGTECYNGVDDDADGTVNDGCRAPATVADPETGIQCGAGGYGNNLDEDGDGVADDGCSFPSGGRPNPETGTQCLGDLDDDSDGFVNDGCPSIGQAESACDNALDDDGDGAVNDGCPRTPRGESGIQCENGLDDDGDTVVNDGCVYPASTGPYDATCPPADAKYCGDGIPGAAPPGCTGNPGTGACAPMAGQGTGCPNLPCNVSQYQFADVDDRHAVLTGSLDNAWNMISLAGCLVDPDGYGPVGNVYVVAKIAAHTGIGRANFFLDESSANCAAGAPAGSAVAVEISAVRQTPGHKSGGCTANLGAVGYTGCRDSDGDGCPDKRELADTANTGGRRDPMNRWDYFNPEKTFTPHNQTISDILVVRDQFGIDQGNALYTIDTDRTGLIGGNRWSLGPPNGLQRVEDILAAVVQYNHNC